MPEGFIQTSFHRDNPRRKAEVRQLIYRQFEVEYAKQLSIGQLIDWQAAKTTGPQTSINLVSFIVIY